MIPTFLPHHLRENKIFSLTLKHYLHLYFPHYCCLSLHKCFIQTSPCTGRQGYKTNNGGLGVCICVCLSVCVGGLCCDLWIIAEREELEGQLDSGWR